MTKKKVIIIGSGIGGLASAITLAKEGYSVTIVEKNDHSGGRCNKIEKDGHYFDTGPTFFIFPQIYKLIFDQFGEKLSDYLNLIRLDPINQVCFDDNTKISTTSNEIKLKSQLEEFETGSFANYLKLMSKSKEHYCLAMQKIIYKDMQHFWDFFTWRNIELISKANIFVPHDKFLKKYFKDPRLRAAFSFQDSYIGLSPFRAPATYSIFAFTERNNGIWYPKGGMYKIVEALEKICLKYGVKFVFNSPVKRILIDKNKVLGVVTLNKKKFLGDYIISNADLSFTYTKLLKTKFKNKKYSCSTISFYWGLKKKYPKLLTHNIFLADTYSRSYDEVINKHKLAQKPHFYIHVPSRADETLAPPKQDSVSVIVPVGHIVENRSQNWEEVKLKAKEYVIARLQKFGLEDIRENIKFEMSATPPMWESEYNLAHGATMGLHHNLFQMGYFRPKRQHAVYKNLFFVGSNTHPGCGVPTVLLSGYFTALQLLNTI